MTGGKEEDEEEDSQVHRIVLHLDSLISLSSTIKCFPGKWQPIKISLRGLHSSLSTIEPDENIILSDLLSSISSTLEFAQFLANDCARENFAGGKLLLRSNLDVLNSKLGFHNQALNEILARRFLSQKAIILCKPKIGAPREEMRLYIKDLYSRMKLSDPEMATLALSSLGEILSEDEKYASILAVDFPEILNLLVQLLESEKEEIQEEAALAVSMIAGFPLYRPLLAAAGAVASLTRVLERGTLSGKERAAKALNNLTENRDNSWSVSAQGGVTTLLNMCEDPRTSSNLLISVCGILRNLAGVTEIRKFMIEKGAVSFFLKLSESKDEISQIQGMEFLRSLAKQDSDAKMKILNEGRVESFVQFFDYSSKLSFSSEAIKTALKAMDTIFFSSVTSVNSLIRLGFLGRLRSLLSHDDIEVEKAAIMAVIILCSSSEEANREMGELGYVPELVKKLKSESTEVREAAAEALDKMVLLQKNQKRFLKEKDGLNSIILLLNSEGKTRTINSVLSVLLAVSVSSSGRRNIVRSGCVEKLGKFEMEDAKKIVKKVSSGRLRSILESIWS